MPITAPSAPPKGRTRTAAKPAPPANVMQVPLSKQAQERSAGLQGWAQIGAMLCLSRGMYADAGAISVHAESICDEAARLADKEEKIAKGLDWLTMTGPYAALVGVSVQFGMQILVNHDRMKVPPGMDGVMPKEALEARVQAQIMTAQAEALKIQRQAEQELAEAQAAMSNLNGEHPQ